MNWGPVHQYGFQMNMLQDVHVRTNLDLQDESIIVEHVDKSFAVIVPQKKQSSNLLTINLKGFVMNATIF